MKIFLANSSFDDIRWASNCGLLDGVLVAPAVVDLEVTSAQEHALEITRVFGCPVILALGSHSADELGREARELARLTDQVILEFPLAIDTVEGLHRAVLDGTPVAASMVFTAAQALLAAKAGASAVLVHMGALEAQGQDAPETLREMRDIFDRQRLECEIIAVRPNSAGQVAGCAASGVDAVVLEISVLRDLLLHPLADRTLDTLLQPTTATYRSRALS
jgi:transaldolase